ncbi:MAG TPA: hypothetical protein VHE14_05240 [Solirubrobacteraceae bacterium]|nr:hypothetical protein [Solirubrobacteraceae bacterium]
MAPLYIEYADSNVDFRYDVFARPGLVLATDGQPGTPKDPQPLRAAGARTIFWDLHMENLVGTPADPVDPSEIPAAVADELARARASSACANPPIALNELLGASSQGPFRGAERTYRANVLALLQGLSAGGAVPFLLLPGSIATNGAAGDYLRQAADVSGLVAEIYFNGSQLFSAGPLLASREVRLGLRNGVAALEALGVPPARLGVMLGFQSMPGAGGRESLQPRDPWFEVVKLQALAGRQVATDENLGTVWSWGWGTFNNPGSADPDKPTAACVYLWARDQSLCNAPLRDPSFNQSLDEGQIALPAGLTCQWDKGQIRDIDIERFKTVLGSRAKAFSLLLQRGVSAAATTVSSAEVKRAERAIIARRYGGSAGRYAAALRRVQTTRKIARSLIGDELARQRLTAQAPGHNYAQWLSDAEKAALDQTTCVRDALPATGPVNLPQRIGFLHPVSANGQSRVAAVGSARG